MRAILIAAIAAALVLAAGPAVHAGHGGGELLRGGTAARR